MGLITQFDSRIHLVYVHIEDNPFTRVDAQSPLDASNSFVMLCTTHATVSIHVHESIGALYVTISPASTI